MILTCSSNTTNNNIIRNQLKKLIHEIKEKLPEVGERNEKPFKEGMVSGLDSRAKHCFFLSVIGFSLVSNFLL